MGRGGEERKEGKDLHRDGWRERENRVVGKKSERWPKVEQKRRRRAERAAETETDAASAERRKRERSKDE